MRKLSIIMLLSISACGGETFREALGLRSNAPDEFMVSTNKPLEIPENFDLPKPNQKHEIIEERVINSDAAALFDDLGLPEAEPKIRSELRNIPKESSFLNFLYPNRDKEPVIDPAEEALRLQKQKLDEL